MPEAEDMEHPVTKRELREELEKYATKDDLRKELEKYPTKEYLHENFPTKEWVTKAFEAWGKAILDELAQHTKAILTAVQGQVATVDEKYNDLPPRVSKLEAKVFAPKRRRTR